MSVHNGVKHGQTQFTLVTVISEFRIFKAEMNTLYDELERLIRNQKSAKSKTTTNKK